MRQTLQALARRCLPPAIERCTSHQEPVRLNERRRDVTSAGEMYSTTGAGAAHPARAGSTSFTAEAGEMHSTTGDGEANTARAGEAQLTAGAGEMYFTTGVGAE